MNPFMIEVKHTCILFLIVAFVSVSDAKLKDIYCGEQNCYDVLNVQRSDTKSTIRKAYYNLARVHHPDKQKSREDREKAESYFRIINAAYEVLSDPEQRQEYDYMLDNPEQLYFNYYRYYRRRYAAKVDVRLVVLAIILIISIVQYVGQQTSYNQALNYLLRDPRHRTKAKEMANAEGLLNLRRGDDGKRLTREQMKDREDEILRSMIINNVDLRGDCCKPSLKRVLAFRILVSPWLIFNWFKWAIPWVWCYWILRQPFDEAAQIYLTRRRLNMSELKWDGLGEERQNHYMSLELWNSDSFKKYIASKEEEIRTQSAESSQHKRYRRYIKRTGGAQIQLDFD